MMPTIRFHSPVLLFLTLLLGAAPASADLPDFTGLVERNAPAVVNVSARKTGGDANDPSTLDGEEVPDILRRFFGEPNAPDGGPHAPREPREPRERVSGGSGFIISGDGYVLTNHHVVDGADDITIRLKDRREFSARLVGSDAQSDVALLKVDATGLPAAVLGNSNALKPGQWVVAIGSPFGLEYSVTAGIVSATGRSLASDQRYVPFIQTDVAINRGNSGGPLFNLAGEVVGINSQIFSNTGGSIGLSFAIPIEVARSVADQLKRTGKVSRGSLGVLIQEVTRDHADALGLPRIGGALVAQINPGSPAEKAGLKVQDVILEYNGVPVERSAELPPLVGNTLPGTKATLTVFRDGRTLSLPVSVAELAADAPLARAAQPQKSAASNPLGIGVRALTADERAELELGEEGVLVEQVSGAEARRAGLQPGDVVLMVGRQRVADPNGFVAAAKAATPGQSVMLLVRRGDASTFIAIRPPATSG